ncbi:unnamed protein product [Macrosiphum euphorbiae]|uniref:FP protein C-terminal domain-containing protein n=1 Tax=Macrosiphum euphorbiae TaxID=13131 RepID=A0AAV0XXN1_9HEMI|nr:unnamed protein product [Macrosiphum euphorbiae]
MSCVQCDKVVSPSKNISCAECKSYFHPQCTKLVSISNYNSLGTDKRFWKCDSCLRSQNLTIRKKTDKSDTNIEPETITDLSSIQSSIKTILTKLENLDKLIISFNGLQESMTFCSNKIDDFSLKIDGIVTNVKQNTIKIQEIENKFTKMQNEIDYLKSSYNTAEQFKLINNLDIMNIPKTANESLFDITSKLTKLLDIEIKEVDISKLYRIKSKSNDTDRIIIGFNDKNKKEAILSAFKSKLKTSPITANQIHTSFPDRKIFLNHQLSTDNRKLLWMTKQLAAIYHFKYVWTNQSGVFLKKSDGDTGVRVSSLSQLQNIDTKKKLNVYGRL